MSQPVKLSDALVLDARLAAEVQERSIAGQVEFWARLGQCIDLHLTGQQRIALLRNGEKQILAEVLATVDSPEGRERVRAHLESLPFPHFEAHPIQTDLLVRIDENGSHTVGRFVNRHWVDVEVGNGAALNPKMRTGADSDAQARSKKRTKL